MVLLQEPEEVMGGAVNAEDRRGLGMCWHLPHLGPDQGSSGDVWGNIGAQIGEPRSAHNKWKEEPVGNMNACWEKGERGRVQVPKELSRTNIR